MQIFRVVTTSVLLRSAVALRFDSVLHSKHSVQILKRRLMVPLSLTAVGTKSLQRREGREIYLNNIGFDTYIHDNYLQPLNHNKYTNIVVSLRLGYSSSFHRRLSLLWWQVSTTRRQKTQRELHKGNIQWWLYWLHKWATLHQQK